MKAEAGPDDWEDMASDEEKGEDVFLLLPVYFKVKAANPGAGCQ